MTKTTDLPELPSGYKWEMVHQCPASVHNPNTGGKWIVRISWTMRNGNHRMLNLKDYYFDTKDQALAYGVKLATDHAVMRELKEEESHVKA
jgi:hypothetical protein